MKKILLLLFITVIFLLSIPYVFIPEKFFISEIIFVKSNRNACLRCLTDRRKWQEFWPYSQTKSKGVTINDTVFKYKDVHYTINPNSIDVIAINIKFKEEVINSGVNIIPLNKDTVAIEWRSHLITGSNPFRKINAYLDAKKIKHDMADILRSSKHFLENEKNIYGINITEGKVKDTILIATKFSTGSYPGTSTIYEHINSLKDYISLHGATETNYPMLHIAYDSVFFETMVAIPLNRRIPESKKFLLKKMVPGKILITGVTGGKYSTEKALNTLELYLSDNHLSSPAIPFQSLITDRLKEPDSVKWQTKVFYPIY